MIWGQTVVPQGGEFSILGAIKGDQVMPGIALSSGKGVLVWQDNVVDGIGAGIGGVLLNGSFTGGSLYRANNHRTGDQLQPQVQLLGGSNQFVVWHSAVGGIRGIYSRLATKGTNFAKIDTRLNYYAGYEVADPVVAALPDGTAVVVWSANGLDKSMWGVFARKVSATGVAEGAKEFQVNQTTLYNQHYPAVATLANGNFVVTWISDSLVASGGGKLMSSINVYARVFTGAGKPVTGEFQVDSGANNVCSRPSVAPLNDGGFTVVWANKDIVPTNGWDIWGRAFTANGAPEVSDFRVNTFLYGDQFQPRIAGGPSGSLVVWTSVGQDGSREGIFARFLAGGTQPSGNEFQVNTTWMNQQIHPAVAWDGLGRYLVVWSSFNGVSSGFDLYGQAYVLSSSP